MFKVKFSLAVSSFIISLLILHQKHDFQSESITKQVFLDYWSKNKQMPVKPADSIINWTKIND